MGLPEAILAVGLSSKTTYGNSSITHHIDAQSSLDDVEAALRELGLTPASFRIVTVHPDAVLTDMGKFFRPAIVHVDGGGRILSR